MITIIILGGVLVYLTMNYAKNNIKNDGMNNIPPNMDNKEDNQMPSNNEEFKNMEEPPAKPDNEEFKNMEEPSAKSDNEKDDTNLVPSERPDNTIKPNEMNKSSLTSTYYIVFIVECLVISGLIIYLIMSNFNSKTIKEPFINKDKIIIGILSVIVLTSILSLLSIKITNDYFITNDNINNMDNNMNNGTNNISYSSNKEINESTNITDENYESNNSDENVLLINGDIYVNISNISVTKTGDSDGGDVKLSMTNQSVTGNIVVDSISTLDFEMSDDSYYEGGINSENEAKEINITLDKSSKIKLTKDSYITSLNNEDSTNSNIDFNGYKLYVSGVSIED